MALGWGWRGLTAAVAGALIALAAFGQSRQAGFTTAVSDNLLGRYSARFGPVARERLLEWQRFARARKTDFRLASLETPAAALTLEAVNAVLNKIPFVSDQAHWGVEDYWSTPAEMVASDGGDCEDFSVAKYFLLKELGVPISRLRITYVTSRRLNQAHMVLAYYPTPDADPLILDNLENTVRPASQRTDLVPVYSFNDDELWLVNKGRAGSPAQIRMWRLLLEHLEQETRI
jgi:predicted transglutaminase-like cysteine proteinase